MKSLAWIRILFALSALYDGLLGLLFILRPDWPFEHFNVPPPNHFGYVEFPAAVIMIFAFMFARIAVNPVRHRELIFYGILLKLAYVWVSGWHWLHGNIPTMWKPFTVIDAICIVLFVVAFASLGGKSTEGSKHR